VRAVEDLARPPERVDVAGEWLPAGSDDPFPQARRAGHIVLVNLAEALVREDLRRVLL
jgi:hypothetical protein